MIKTEKKLKGKSRLEAVVKTKQANINFNVEPDKDGMVIVVVPSGWFEDQECRLDGLGNELEQENFIIKIPKKKIDIINTFIYEGIAEQILKDGVKV